MSNIYILFIEVILCFLLMLIMYKKDNINSLYYYAVIIFILSNLMSLETIELYDFELNLGIIPFTSIFIASNIIIQRKGPEEIKKLIMILLATSILSYITLYLVSLMNSSNINLFTSASYDNIFIDSPRIYFSNIVTMLYTLFFNSKLYYYLKKEKNQIWLSNIFSNIIIQFISSILFSFLAYAITKEVIDVLKLTMIRYIISLVVCFIGTFIIYITKNIKKK